MVDKQLESPASIHNLSATGCGQPELPWEHVDDIFLALGRWLESATWLCRQERWPAQSIHLFLVFQAEYLHISTYITYVFVAVFVYLGIYLLTYTYTHTYTHLLRVYTSI